MGVLSVSSREKYDSAVYSSKGEELVSQQRWCRTPLKEPKALYI